MKGIIMAGGEGTRLRPLTCDCPKPMIRLMGRPLMEYALELLRAHGICDVAVTLGYRPEAITAHFGDGSEFGVHIEYRVEHTPLGTAGGVRQAADFLDETFVVLSGDALTDLDLAAAIEFHRDRGALATLVLKRAENPLDYGVVDTDAHGRVLRFHEKPDWADVTSDTVNTGIYILEPALLREIPEGRACDFGHELFPRLVADGTPVYGFVAGDYWCDVGDVRAYLASHIDTMEGRVRLPSLQFPTGRALVCPGAVVDRAAVLEGPCLVESGARVRAGACIGPYSVIGEGCDVGEGASVKRGVLWPGARLERRAQARGCVLAAGAILGEGAQAYEECVLGTGARLEANSVALPGVKLWPGKRASEGERLDANRVWGGCRGTGFFAGAICVDTAADAARAAQACAASMKPREMLLAHSGEPGAEALWHAAAAGVMVQGVQVIDLGACARPVLRHACRTMGADAALFVSSDAITPLNGLGARLTGRARRAVAQLFARQDYAAPAVDRPLSPICAGGAELAYVATAARRFSAPPDRAAPVLLTCGNPRLRAAALRAFERAGLLAQVKTGPGEARLPDGGIGIEFDCAGEHCSLRDGLGALTDAQQQLFAAWVLLELGERTLLLPDSATRGIEALAGRCGARVEYVSGETARWMNALADRMPAQFELQFDGLQLSLAALSLLAARGMSLAEWRQAMPEVHRRSRTLPLPSGQNGRVLGAFARSQPDAVAEGGVRLRRDGGWAWIGAEEDRSALRIVAEGASSEFAAELCDFCEGALKRLCVEGESPSPDPAE